MEKGEEEEFEIFERIMKMKNINPTILHFHGLTI